jgi:hypothetical protein
VIADLIMFALTISTFFFVGSLFLGDSERGRSLARAAAFCFSLAFVPPMLAYLGASLSPFVPNVGSGVKLLLLVMVGFFFAVVVPFASYGFLEFRKGTRRRGVVERGYDKDRSRRERQGDHEAHP